jgi:3-deoxy-D-arabino-heptulosonate 7-phosphate (DAHP) synthase class II
MDQPHVSEFDVVTNPLGVKPGEKSRGRRTVKTFVVKEDPDFQESS